MPAPGQVAVPRNGPVEVYLSTPPAAATVADNALRVFSGLIGAGGTLRVVLLDQRIRFSPLHPLRADLRYQAYLSKKLRGLNGAGPPQSVVLARQP